MLTLKEKALYHQIHPAKLSTDILASVISLYFFWQHQLVVGLATHFVAPLAASALLLRYGDFEAIRNSGLGRYIAGRMTRAVEGARLFGDIVTVLGAWTHDWLLIAGGFVIIIGAWCNGLLRSRVWYCKRHG